jgi:hypothetical protein
MRYNANKAFGRAPFNVGNILHSVADHNIGHVGILPLIRPLYPVWKVKSTGDLLQICNLLNNLFSLEAPGIYHSGLFQDLANGIDESILSIGLRPTAPCICSSLIVPPPAAGGKDGSQLVNSEVHVLFPF